jgi:tetraprenyl-beta-curcumene synthase
MGHYADFLLEMLQYSSKVLPELHRQEESISESIAICSKLFSYPGKNTIGISSTCSSFLALHPGADIKGTVEFTLALSQLTEAIERARAASHLSDEAEIRKLFNCLSGAIDPSRSTGCIAGESLTAVREQEPAKTHISCLADSCRLQLAVLPSFSVVAPKLKKYIQLYIDLQSYRHCPPLIRSECLKTWSSFYMMRCQGISCWEFCAASDSLLGVAAMYTAARDPALSREEARLLDEACFPWLCGLESLLKSYVAIRLASGPEHLNYSFYYKNLQDYEERLSFFIKKSVENCLRLKNSSFYISLIRLMLGLYLSDPEATFGMCRLSTARILKAAPPYTISCCNFCKVLRFWHIIR